MHPSWATCGTCYYPVYYPVLTSTKSDDDYLSEILVFRLF
jgi:hypothetical protein